MFFNIRKKAKLAEAAQKAEQQRIQEEENKKTNEYHEAYEENKKIFHDICHNVRSLPKKRQIVVVQRQHVFKSDHARNWWYLKMAEEMRRQYRNSGGKTTWISGNNDSLFAFYAPIESTPEFQKALQKFSEGGYRIQRIRYYNFNY